MRSVAATAGGFSALLARAMTVVPALGPLAPAVEAPVDAEIGRAHV